MRLPDPVVEKLDAYLDANTSELWRELESALSAWLASLDDDAARADALSALTQEITDLGSSPELREQMVNLTTFVDTQRGEATQEGAHWG